MHNILFIGLGTMGYPMAGHLSQINNVTVYNRTLSKSKNWAKEYGGKIIEALSEINGSFDFIISCVGNDNDLKEITLSENGCFQNIKNKTIFIDHSTVSPNLVKLINNEASKLDIHFLDAPISGGEVGAINGALSIMIGGDLSSFYPAEKILQVYGKKIKYMGKSGSGQLTKIINQICIAGLVQGLSEAINFGMKAGLNMEDVIEVISKGAAQSWQMENRYKTMIDDKFDFGFAVDWMRKDLKIAMEEAKNNGSLLPVTELVDKYYGEVQGMGGNRWDTSSLIKRFRK